MVKQTVERTIRALDGRKSYITGIALVVTAVLLFALQSFADESVRESLPPLGTTIELFYAGLALIGLRSAASKVLVKQDEKIQSVDRLTRILAEREREA